MALHTGLAVNSISTDAVDVRLGVAGLVLRDSAGVPRSGVFPAHTSALVSGRTNMQVDVAAFAAAFSRGATYGTVLFGNDGTTQVTVAAAPTANSRIDLIYVAVPDVTSGDVAAVPSFKVVTGTASATPVKPALPTGGLELATIQVPSTATTTSSANVVITQTFQYTTTAGGVLLLRAASELTGLLLFPVGTRARIVSSNASYEWNGSGWAGSFRRHAFVKYEKTDTTVGGGVTMATYAPPVQPSEQRVRVVVSGTGGGNGGGGGYFTVTAGVAGSGTTADSPGGVSGAGVSNGPWVTAGTYSAINRTFWFTVPANVAATFTFTNDASLAYFYRLGFDFQTYVAGEY